MEHIPSVEQANTRLCSLAQDPIQVDQWVRRLAGLTVETVLGVEYYLRTGVVQERTRKIFLQEVEPICDLIRTVGQPEFNVNINFDPKTIAHDVECCFMIWMTEYNADFVHAMIACLCLIETATREHDRPLLSAATILTEASDFLNN